MKSESVNLIDKAIKVLSHATMEAQPHIYINLRIQSSFRIPLFNQMQAFG